MRAKDLPIYLQELAKQRCYDQGQYYDENIPLTVLFIFGITPEGGEFWTDISKGNRPQSLSKLTGLNNHIELLNTEWVMTIESFKYNKQTQTFTINHRDILKIIDNNSAIVRKPDNNQLPKRIHIHNTHTGVTGIFAVDLPVDIDQVNIPQGATIYKLSYEHIFKSYSLDIIIDAKDIPYPSLTVPTIQDRNPILTPIPTY